MSTHPKASTRGNYRQVRLTFTQELNGRCSVSVYAKPLNKAWHEHQCMIRTSVPMAWPLNSTEDVLAALVLIIEDFLLPVAGPSDSE